MDDVNYMQLAWDVAQFTLTGIVWWYVYLSQRAQVRREALTHLEHDVDDRLDGVLDRLTKIEAKMETAPTWSKCAVHGQRVAVLEEAFRGAIKSADLGRVHQRIDSLEAAVAELRGELKASAHLLQTIDHHLRQISHNP